MNERMNEYNDVFLQTLHKIVRNIPRLGKLDNDSIRSLAFLMKKYHTNAKQTVIKVKEVCTKIYFVYSGVVCVNIVDTETDERKPFQYLGHGSVFNLSNAILSYYSIFDIVSENE